MVHKETWAEVFPGLNMCCQIGEDKKYKTKDDYIKNFCENTDHHWRTDLDDEKYQWQGGMYCFFIQPKTHHSQLAFFT